MSETKEAPKGWTAEEKAALYFQIIERSGGIPWDELTLPEGRTKKACQVMIDKEKAKVKKAREAAGMPPLEVTPKATPKAKGKRKAEGDAETPASSAKKTKGRKKKGEEEREVDSDNAEDGETEEAGVKAEEKDNDTA